MALIKCPECGRENVSDSAAMCPDCGFTIKAHFDNIKREETEKQQDIIQQGRLEQEKSEQERMREEYKEMLLKSMPKPKKIYLVYSAIMFIASVILAFLAVVGYMGMNGYRIGSAISKDVAWGYLYDFDVVFLLATFAFVFFCCGVLLIYETAKRKKRLNDDSYISKRVAMYRPPLRDAGNVINIECPYCHSNNTARITTGSRAASIALFGIWSQKRMHQWHCNNCKSDF